MLVNLIHSSSHLRSHLGEIDPISVEDKKRYPPVSRAHRDKFFCPAGNVRGRYLSCEVIGLATHFILLHDPFENPSTSTIARSGDRLPRGCSQDGITVNSLIELARHLRLGSTMVIIIDPLVHHSSVSQIIHIDQ